MRIRTKLFASHLLLVFIALLAGGFLFVSMRRIGHDAESAIRGMSESMSESAMDSATAIVVGVQNEFLRVFLLSVVVGTGVSALVSWYFSTFFLQSILSLRSVMRERAEGIFGRRLFVQSRDEFGELTEAFNTMADEVDTRREIIEQKVLEKTADLEKFKLALNNISDHVVITDADGIVLYANQMVERITGYAVSEVIGKKAGKLWSLPMPAEYYRTLWETIREKKQVFVGELQNRRKNGQVYTAVVSVSPVLDDAGTVRFFVGVERDVTHEREIDRAKSEFVSLASHQLRTPLSAINWYTEMLLSGDGGPITDMQRDYLEEVNRASRRMVELVGALLNVSRIELGTFAVLPEPTDIVSLAEDVFAELKPKIIEKRLRIETNYEPGFPRVSVDPRLFRIVLQNLLTNAVKYTPEEGRVFLAVETVADKRFAVTVSDTGYGIPKDEQSSIFTKLFRASNVRERETDGTGLGLYITKSIIEHAEGTIEFESEEKRGTTFRIMLPCFGMRRKEGAKQLEWQENIGSEDGKDQHDPLSNSVI